MDAFCPEYIVADKDWKPITKLEFIPAMDFKMNDITGVLDVLHRPIITISISHPVTCMKADVRALIDTGSPYMFLTKDVIDFLNLEKVSNKTSRSFQSEDTIGEYLASINITGENKTQGMPFRVFDNKGADVNCLFGANVLSLFEFVYNKPKGSFILKYLG